MAAVAAGPGGRSSPTARARPAPHPATAAGSEAGGAATAGGALDRWWREPVAGAVGASDASPHRRARHGRHLRLAEQPRRRGQRPRRRAPLRGGRHGHVLGGDPHGSPRAVAEQKRRPSARRCRRRSAVQRGPASTASSPRHPPPLLTRRARASRTRAPHLNASLMILGDKASNICPRAAAPSGTSAHVLRPRHARARRQPLRCCVVRLASQSGS